MTRIVAATLSRLAVSASADLAYPLGQLPTLGAMVIPIAVAQLVAVRIRSAR